MPRQRVRHPGTVRKDDGEASWTRRSAGQARRRGLMTGATSGHEALQAVEGAMIREPNRAAKASVLTRAGASRQPAGMSGQDPLGGVRPQAPPRRAQAHKAYNGRASVARTALGCRRALNTAVAGSGAKATERPVLEPAASRVYVRGLIQTQAQSI